MSMIHQFALFVVGAKYKIFWGYVIAVWLWGVILHLFLAPGFYDVALRNLALALGVLALACLSNRIQNNVLLPAYAVAKRK